MPDVLITEAPAEDKIFRSVGQVGPSRVGRSAGKRQRAVMELVRTLQFETRKDSDGRITGPLRPCTIVNFNPLALVVEGQLHITIPKPKTTKHHQIQMPFKGRLMHGHYCYVASPMAGERPPDKQPIFYTTTVGHEQDELLPIDVPVSEPRVFSPHSIACELLAQYNSPSNKMMGGILVFDQDPHTLSAANLEKTGGRIWVPERHQLEGSYKYSYTLRETLLEDELDRIFETQRNYCDVMMQQAHTWFTDEDVNSRRLITDTHRDWARFAHENGYLEGNLPEWVSARLALSSEVRQLMTCKYCGNQQQNPKIFFCKVCRAPYDAFKAYTAGLHVADAYLQMLEGEELETVLRLQQERKRKFTAAAAPSDDEPDPAPADPLATARAAKAAKAAAKKAAEGKQE
jgi:hypothetical protein